MFHNLLIKILWILNLQSSHQLKLSTFAKVGCRPFTMVPWLCMVQNFLTVCLKASETFLAAQWTLSNKHLIDICSSFQMNQLFLATAEEIQQYTDQTLWLTSFVNIKQFILVMPQYDAYDLLSSSITLLPLCDMIPRFYLVTFFRNVMRCLGVP